MADEEMSYSESCEELVKVIQAGEHEYTTPYVLMLATFIDALENDETPRMALALAKDAPAAADRDMELGG